PPPRLYKLHNVDDGIIFSNSNDHLKILRKNLKQSLRLKWLDTPDKIVASRSIEVQPKSHYLNIFS
ncbi:uncharacterized protein VP01_2206g2, partial [Puccinia sorghi]